MVRYSQMPVGFGPCLLLEGKQERKVGAVIVLRTPRGWKVSAVMWDTYSLAQSCPFVLLAEAVSHRDVMGIHAFKTMRVISDCSNGMKVAKLFGNESVGGIRIMEAERFS